MTLYIDGKYIYEKIFYDIQHEQRQVYESKKHIGSYVPVNSYVLVFDTLVRIINRYKDVISYLQKKYKITKVIFVKNTLNKRTIRYYDRYDRKTAGIKNYIYQLARCITKYNYFNKTNPNDKVDKSIKFMSDKFKITEWKSNFNKETKCEIIPVYLFYLAIYQNFITTEINNYMYNLLALNERNTIISNKIDFRKLRNCYILTEKGNLNNCVITYDLEMKGKINNNSEVVEIIEEINIEEKRKLKKICDSEYGEILNVNDDNIMLILSKIVSTYKKPKATKYAETCDYPRSFSSSDYTLFKPLFVKINTEMNLNLNII